MLCCFSCDMSILCITGAVPIIRCPRGNAAEMVAERLDKKLRENVRDPRNSLFKYVLYTGICIWAYVIYSFIGDWTILFIHFYISHLSNNWWVMLVRPCVYFAYLTRFSVMPRWELKCQFIALQVASIIHILESWEVFYIDILHIDMYNYYDTLTWEYCALIDLLQEGCGQQTQWALFVYFLSLVAHWTVHSHSSWDYRDHY